MGHRRNDSYIENQYNAEYSLNSEERYKHLNKLLLADGKLINATLSPWDMLIYPHSNLGSYVVTAGEENRIDIVATKVYGNASLYWVLCYANGIKDPLKLPIGTYLVVPDIRDLFSYPNPLA